MKKTVSLVTVLLAVAGLSAPATARSASPLRAEAQEYIAPAPGYYGGHELGWTYVVNACDYPEDKAAGCLKFDPEPGERFVKLTVEDQTERPIYFNVILWERGEWLDYCGYSTGIIDVSDVQDEFWVTIPNGTCADSRTPSAATRGTVTAVFGRTRSALRKAG